MQSTATVDARVRVLTAAAGVAGGVVALIGILVIAGWVFGVPALTRIIPGLVTMKFATAACLVAVGSAIALMAASLLAEKPALARLALGAAALVGLAATTTLVEDALGLRLAVDNPFGLDPGDPSTPVPGRMAQMTAVSLLGLAAGVALTARHAVRAAQALAVGAISVGLMALVGYAYGVQSLYGVGPFNSIAVHAATAVVIAGAGVLFLRPGEGYVSVVVGNTAGGVIMRRLLPWVVLVPNVVGAVVVVGLRRGEYDGPVALAILVTCVAVAAAALVWFQAEHLRDVDLRREGAEDALAIAQEALAERDRIQMALAASERRTRRILSAAADGYIAIDGLGRVSDWNDAATKIFGWTRDEALGEYLAKLIVPPAFAPPIGSSAPWHLLSGEPGTLGTQREVEAITRSGTRIPVELTVWADGDPASRGLHAFVRDISARKKAELDLRNANDDLTEFAAVAAHDLRSPLSTIRMQVDLLREHVEEDPAGPDVAALIDRIAATADRGVFLIDELLAYVSIGRHSYAFGPVDLEELARDVADQQIAATGREATCEVRSLPVICGDAPLLGQLLGNLLGNALKYVPADRAPEVVVDVVEGPESGQCVVRVTDNGTGFAPDERERVFDMFTRGRRAIGIEGTGIGLAICRRVAERHGGRIWIETGPGSGSRVCVQLPLWDGSAADAGTVVARPSKARAASR